VQVFSGAVSRLHIRFAVGSGPVDGTPVAGPGLVVVVAVAAWAIVRDDMALFPSFSVCGATCAFELAAGARGRLCAADDAGGEDGRGGLGSSLLRLVFGLVEPEGAGGRW
jgi:hypothetical protein